jgi:hypothetical protein
MPNVLPALVSTSMPFRDFAHHSVKRKMVDMAYSIFYQFGAYSELNALDIISVLPVRHLGHQGYGLSDQLYQLQLVPPLGGSTAPEATILGQQSIRTRQILPAWILSGSAKNRFMSHDLELVVCMERKQLSEYFFRSCCKLGQNIG